MNTLLVDADAALRDPVAWAQLCDDLGMGDLPLGDARDLAALGCAGGGPGLYRALLALERGETPQTVCGRLLAVTRVSTVH